VIVFDQSQRSIEWITSDSNTGVITSNNDLERILVITSIWYRLLGTKYLVPSTWCQVLGNKSLLPSTWHPELGTGYLALSTWQVFGTKCLVPSTTTWYQLLGIKYEERYDGQAVKRMTTWSQRGWLQRLNAVITRIRWGLAFESHRGFGEFWNASIGRISPSYYGVK